MRPDQDQGYVDAWVQKADAQRALKQYNESLLSYNSALQIDAKKAGAWSGATEAYTALKDYANASAAAAKATESDGSKGNLLQIQGKYQEAIAKFDAAIALDPLYKDAIYKKGVALMTSGSITQAIPLFDGDRSRIYAGIDQQDAVTADFKEDRRGHADIREALKSRASNFYYNLNSFNALENEDYDMSKALVTGGAGFIGSNLVESIVDRYEVTVLDNFHTGSMSNLDGVRKDIRVIKGSCNDALAYDLCPDVIFHLGIPSSSPMYKSNPLLVGEAVNGTIAVMELARRSGTKKVVIASSSSLYNGLPTPHREDAHILVTDYYTEARLAIERIAELYYRLYGVDYAALRFFSVYGPHELAKGTYANMISQFMWDMQAGKAPVIFGDGEQTRDFTFVRDVTDGMILAAGKGTGVYNLGTGKSYNFNYVVDLLNNKLGTSLNPTYRENPIKNYVRDTLADTERMKALGFVARWSLEEGIDEIMKA